MLRLTKAIIKLTKTKSKIVFKSLPQDDPKVRFPDITKAKKLLGWEPNVKLEQGLKLGRKQPFCGYFCQTD